MVDTCAAEFEAMTRIITQPMTSTVKQKSDKEGFGNRIGPIGIGQELSLTTVVHSVWGLKDGVMKL